MRCKYQRMATKGTDVAEKQDFWGELDNIVWLIVVGTMF